VANEFPPLSELKAARFANYKGKVEANIGSLRGPNTLGEIMAIVSVGYDETTDKSRIGFAFTGMRWDF
jgi:hypothetical protein